MASLVTTARVRQLAPGLRYRQAFRSLITGFAGSGSWMEATSESIDSALSSIARDNVANPDLYHWLDFDLPATNAEPVPSAFPATVVNDEALRYLETLSDDELSRRAARALALPVLRYATSFGDAYDMEGALPQEAREDYPFALAQVTGSDDWDLLRATPRERCLAALLAMGEASNVAR